MSHPPPNRALRTGTLLLLAGLCAGIVVCEAAYRVGRHFVCLPDHQSYFVPRAFGWTHQPNARLRLYGCAGRRFEWRAHLRINALGLRDRDIPHDKPPDTMRVLVLGDSITEAVQVEVEQTFVKRAEALLQRSAPTLQFINAGHAGFGTDNELLFYREEGRRYAPDLVLLVFNLQNDVLENSPVMFRRLYAQAAVHFPPKVSFEVASDGTLQPVPPVAIDDANRAVPWYARVHRAIAKRFYLVREIERRLAPAPALPQALPFTFAQYAPPNEEWTSAWEVTRRLLLALRSEVERDGSRFAVVVMPTREMASPLVLARAIGFFGLEGPAYDVEQPHRLIAALLRDAAIPTLDLSPVLHDLFDRTGKTGFFDWDVHLSADGHATVSVPIAGFVQAQLEAPDA